MAERVVASLLLAGLTAGVALLLVRQGVLLTPEAASIRRVRRLLVRRESAMAKAIDRSLIGRLLQDRIDVRRMMLAAGRGADPYAFTRRLVVVAAVAVAVLLVGDIVTVIAGSGLAIAPVWLPVVAILAPIAAIADLHREAQRRRDTASLQVAKTLLLFGVLRVPPVLSPTGMQAGDPLVALARTMRTAALHEMLETDAWRQFVSTEPHTRAELLEALSDAYRIPMFAQLAQVVRTAQEYGGTDPATEYLATARAFTAQRLADARVRLSSRTITVLVPMLGLLAAIFVVIFSAIAYASANGGL